MIVTDLCQSLRSTAYRINVYNLFKKIVYSEQVDEYPSDDKIRRVLADFTDCFADICRVADDPFEHSLNIMDDLEVELVYEDRQYA